MFHHPHSTLVKRSKKPESLHHYERCSSAPTCLIGCTCSQALPRTNKKRFETNCSWGWLAMVLLTTLILWAQNVFIGQLHRWLHFTWYQLCPTNTTSSGSHLPQLPLDNSCWFILCSGILRAEEKIPTRLFGRMATAVQDSNILWWPVSRMALLRQPFLHSQ